MRSYRSRVGPWLSIPDRWFVDASTEEVKERLITRHLRAGIETSRSLALLRVECNDMANADLIRTHMLQPDLTIVC